MTFSELNLHNDILRALPASITTPTLIQQHAIPAIFHHADVFLLLLKLVAEKHLPMVYHFYK